MEISRPRTALDLESSVGFDRIEQHAARLAELLVDRVEALGWRPFRRPDDPGASPRIVSLRHDRHLPVTAATRLASDHRIVCGGRGDGLRISLHVYNDESDVDRLVGSLREG